MFFIQKKLFFLFTVALLTVATGYSQNYNTEIEAKIELENNNEFIKITGTAFNKTDISQSLRYVLSVIKTNPENNNESKNDQSGRIVLQPAEKQNLSTTTINANGTDKIIILLLVFDLDDIVKGKDRIILNDDGNNDIEVKQDIIQNIVEQENNSKDVDNSHSDGVFLKGIVIEDTKTKPGRDFYSMFYSMYNLYNINAEKIVSIKEVLALGTNTKIEVTVDDTTIFEFFARPNQEYLKNMSEISIRRLIQYFQKLKKEKEIIKQY